MVLSVISRTRNTSSSYKRRSRTSNRPDKTRILLTGIESYHHQAPPFPLAPLLPEFVKCPAGFSNPQENLKIQQRVRSRQETINKRFKDWGCRHQTWRHDIASHGRAFGVILIVLQLAINTGEKLFTVDEEELSLQSHYSMMVIAIPSKGVKMKPQCTPHLCIKKHPICA